MTRWGEGAPVRTCLWMQGNGLEAARFWTSVVPGSEMGGMFEQDPARPPLVIDFTLGGTPYQILNVTDGPDYRHTEAASISVQTRDQDETDRLWAALTDGGREVMCGWLQDRFGVFWQIVPEAFPRLMSDPDRAAAGRAYQAMTRMVKLDIAALEAAFRGE